jgi:hypothetical protein
MQVRAITGAAIAALAVGAIATPSFAQDPCHQHKRSNGTAGAVLGGIAGAVIGSNIPHHHGARTGGAIIGGVAGAAIGNSIGRSSTHCDGYTYYNGRYYYNQPSTSYYNGYYDGRYGYNGYYSRPYYNGYYDNGYYNNGYYPY